MIVKLVTIEKKMKSASLFELSDYIHALKANYSALYA
jgi:hypothetical protein